MNKAAWCAVAAGVVFVGVAIHEWSYRSGHPHRAGVSGLLVVFSLAAALLAGSVAAMAFMLDARDKSDERSRAEEFRRARLKPYADAVDAAVAPLPDDVRQIVYGGVQTLTWAGDPMFDDLDMIAAESTIIEALEPYPEALAAMQRYLSAAGLRT